MKRLMISLNDDIFDIIDAKALSENKTASELCKEILVNTANTFTPVAGNPCTQQIVDEAIKEIRNYVKTLSTNKPFFVLSDVPSYQALPHGHKIKVGKEWNILVDAGEPNVTRAKTKNDQLKFRGSAAVYKRV